LVYDTVDGTLWGSDHSTAGHHHYDIRGSSPPMGLLDRGWGAGGMRWSSVPEVAADLVVTQTCLNPSPVKHGLFTQGMKNSQNLYSSCLFKNCTCPASKTTLQDDRL